MAAHLIKLACELPDAAGRSLSLWTCAEPARALVRDGIVVSISPQSVQRILFSKKLKPWRVHYWLHPKTPLDEGFRTKVVSLCDLYTRPLAPHERVLCLDEMTSIQPRCRPEATRPAQPELQPVKLEHQYSRGGATVLLAAFDTRTGEVTGICRPRKRQVEFIELLELIDHSTVSSVTLIHVVCDNVSTHHGKLVQAWLVKHPRFRMHFTPVHCSWMNQIEQWFSILRRKRLRAPNFADLTDLKSKISSFITEWNELAHPFAWSPKSFEKILRKVDNALAVARAAA